MFPGPHFSLIGPFLKNIQYHEDIVFLNAATKSHSSKQGVPLLLLISLKNSFRGIFNKVQAEGLLANLEKVSPVTDIFQGISLQVQLNRKQLNGKTPVCITPLEGCFSSSYSGVMSKKGITKKFVEVFRKDRNSSSKVTNKFKTD